VAQYNANSVHVTYCQHSINGWEPYSTIDIMLINKRDNLFTLTFTLLNSSNSNSILHSLLENDCNTPNGTIGSLNIQDVNGISIAKSTQAWIDDQPDFVINKYIWSISFIRDL